MPTMGVIVTWDPRDGLEPDPTTTAKANQLAPQLTERASPSSTGTLKEEHPSSSKPKPDLTMPASPAPPPSTVNSNNKSLVSPDQFTLRDLFPDTGSFVLTGFVTFLISHPLFFFLLGCQVGLPISPPNAVEAPAGAVEQHRPGAT